MPDFRGFVRQNLGALGVTPVREAEVVEELAQDLEERYARAFSSGLAPEAAWAQVTKTTRPWRELRTELARELRREREEREPAPTRYAGSLGRDLRYALRQIGQSPAFALAAVLMLAIGIGANTAIFTLLNAVLLRPLPVRDPSQLVFFSPAHAEGSTDFYPNGNGQTEIFSYAFLRAFRERIQTTPSAFSDAAAIDSDLIQTHGRIGAGSAETARPDGSGAAPEKLNVELVSGSYFPMLGVGASLGRVLNVNDDRTPGMPAIAVASDAWWQRRFPDRRAINGRTIAIGSTLYTLVGVAQPGFSGVTVGQSPDLWIPLTMEKQISPDENGLDNNFYQSLHVIARLRPDASLAGAQANANLWFQQIERGFLGPEPGPHALEDIAQAHFSLTRAATGRSDLRGLYANALETLMAVVALVLLIACANVANLLLARATGRRREMAVRLALGAKRSRLVGQLMVESALLGAAGAGVGIAFALWCSRALLALVSAGSEPIALQIAPDWRVLTFTAAAAVVTVLFFGIVPALRATHVELGAELKAAAAASAGRIPLARPLVIAQVALSVVLLAGAGLFLRSLAKQSAIELGFDKTGVVCLTLDPTGAGYGLDARLTEAMQHIEAQARALPGVSAASFAYAIFDGGGWRQNNLLAPGQPPPPKPPSVELNMVGPDYFRVLGVPVLLGRAFDTEDTAAGRKVAIINQTLARDFFGTQSPLGHTLSIRNSPDLQNVAIVGVVKDTKYRMPDEPQEAAAFFPYAQLHRNYLNYLLVQYSGDVGAILPGLRDRIRGVDPNLPVDDARTLTQLADDFTINTRLVALLAGIFGVLAAALAAAGIYAVMAYAIAQRKMEFGIRMALGAARGVVLRMVLTEALVMAGAGVSIGVVLALASGRAIASQLYQVNPNSPATLAAAGTIMVAIALLAGFMPARRVTRVDPATVLRYE